MITTLHIKNIGIIEDITIDFNDGFNVLTGETGTGKSLIIDSFNIISGGRFSKEMIRHGQNSSLVEACIYKPKSKEAIDGGNIIVSREVFNNGRNLCKINGRLITVAELKFFMSEFVDIHAQYDNQSLMDISKHIKILDSFSAKDILCLKGDYEEKFLEFQNIKSELMKNYGDDMERQRKVDILSYQLNEIDEADLQIGEEEQLEERKKILQSSEKIIQNVNVIENKLENCILEDLEIVIKSLGNIEYLNKFYEEKMKVVNNSYYDLQELLRDISDHSSNLDFDSQTNTEVQSRLDLIFNLKRKYGNSIEEILEYRKEIDNEIRTIENLEDYINGLKLKLNNIEDDMYTLSKKIHEVRKENAAKLEKKINAELKSLEMENANFKINISFDIDRKFSKNALNKVEFLVSTNIGEEYKSLTKVASGGEISRIMLAIKTITSNVEEVSTVVFDEIDTGISGIAAKSVGEKIKNISKNCQVIAVTHQPILTAMANHHYKIQKHVYDNKTCTDIKLLAEEEVIQEIARISTGSITKTALDHAKELRNTSICA